MTAPTPPSAALAPTPAIAPVTPEGGALRAKFNPLIRPSLVLQIGGLLAMSIVGLPLALIWFLGVGQWWARHYFDKLDCHLDERKLRYQKGILVTVEKTIPLENIQDVDLRRRADPSALPAEHAQVRDRREQRGPGERHASHRHHRCAPATRQDPRETRRAEAPVARAAGCSGGGRLDRGRAARCAPGDSSESWTSWWPC